MTDSTKAPVTFDMSLDDIDDLPSFKTFPSGAYHVMLAAGIICKDVNNKDCAEIAMTLVKVEEITEVLPHPNAEGEDKEPAAGDVMTTLFQLDNATGAGLFKEFLKPLAAHTGERNIQAICDKSKGLELMVVIKRTWNKDKDRFFGNLKQVAVL